MNPSLNTTPSAAKYFVKATDQAPPNPVAACALPVAESAGTHATTVPKASPGNPSDSPVEPASGLALPDSQVIELLDPVLVRAGIVPNRLPESYSNEAFEDLRQSIGAMKGNAQAILVRRLLEDPDGDLGGPRYELIYGARRLEACRLEDVKVKAIVCTATGSSVLETLIENSSRADLCPFELGRQINSALSQGAGLSQRSLARKIGRNVSIVSRALAIALLPPEVIKAFASPADIRYADSKPLTDALERSSSAVLDEAGQIVQEGVALDGRLVVKRLIAAGTGGVAQVNTPASTRLSLDGEEFGEAVFDALGRSTISLQIKLTESQQAALIKQIESFVSRKVKRKKSTDLPTKDPANMSHARPKGSGGKSNEVVS